MKEDNNDVFHTTCFACGKENDHGLQLKFKDDPNGCNCNVSIPKYFQSYDSVVHGGIVATLLDAAMVHCLRLQDDDAPITCRLEVRFLQAVPPGTLLTIKAKRKGKRGKIALADAELQHENNCYARARGAFIISKQNKV